MSGSEATPAEPGPGRHGLPELIAERRAKAEHLRASDTGAFPYSFAGTEPIARILEAYDHLAAGEETEDAHRVAGRLAARRGSGGSAFLDLVDRTGKIQLHARRDVLGHRREQPAIAELARERRAGDWGRCRLQLMNLPAVID